MSKCIILLYSTCLIIMIISCTRPFRPVEWKKLESRFVQDSSNLLALTRWLAANSEESNSSFVNIDSLPSDIVPIVKSADIVDVLVKKNGCSGNLHHLEITYRVDWVQKTDGIFAYVVYSSCLSDERSESMSANGISKRIGKEWCLVQKNYDWFFE